MGGRVAYFSKPKPKSDFLFVALTTSPRALNNTLYLTRWHGIAQLDRSRGVQTSRPAPGYLATTAPITFQPFFVFVSDLQLQRTPGRRGHPDATPQSTGKKVCSCSLTWIFFHLSPFTHLSKHGRNAPTVIGARQPVGKLRHLRSQPDLSPLEIDGPPSQPHTSLSGRFAETTKRGAEQYNGMDGSRLTVVSSCDISQGGKEKTWSQRRRRR